MNKLFLTAALLTAATSTLSLAHAASKGVKSTSQSTPASLPQCFSGNVEEVAKAKRSAQNAHRLAAFNGRQELKRSG